MAIVRADAYYIEGVRIKNPTTFKIERYKVTNANRLANSDMVADVLGRKRKFFFTYDAITGDELDKILDILWENMDYFFNFTYVENGVTKSAIVYPGAIPSELHNPTGKWVWKGVNFDLIEQ